MGFCFICRYDLHQLSVDQRLTKSTTLALPATIPRARYENGGERQPLPVVSQTHFLRLAAIARARLRVEFVLIRLYEFRLLCDSFSFRRGQVPRLKIDPCLLAAYFHQGKVCSGCRMLVDALRDRPKGPCLPVLFFPDLSASGCTFGDNYIASALVKSTESVGFQGLGGS